MVICDQKRGVSSIEGYSDQNEIVLMIGGYDGSVNVLRSNDYFMPVEE